MHETNANYQRNAEEDRAKSAQAIGDACREILAVELVSCLEQHLEAYYQEQATNQDLQAQQDMALWAKWLLFSTGASLVLSLVGVMLLYRTIRQGQFSLQATEKALQRDLRPKLRFRQVVLNDPKPNVPISGYIYLINEGDAAANIKKSNIRIYWARTLPAVHPFERTYNPLPEAIVTLAAGKVARWDFNSEDESMSDADFDGLRSGVMKLYVMCRIEYSDDLGVEHREIATYFFDRKEDRCKRVEDEDYNYSH